ncbi:MAG: hypothetical protein IJ061_00055 [Lachnospiraceae bacterium]|nr:hypothetical protein [Lachnospiraceae bacterium]
MFGFGKKKNMVTVRLTQEELARLEAGMTPKQLKEFRQRQKDFQNESYEDGFMMGYILGED